MSEDQSFEHDDTVTPDVLNGLEKTMKAASIPAVFDFVTQKPTYVLPRLLRTSLYNEILDMTVHLMKNGFTPTGIVIQDVHYYQLSNDLRSLSGRGKESGDDEPLTFAGLPLLIVDDGILSRPFVVTRSRPR